LILLVNDSNGVGSVKIYTPVIPVGFPQRVLWTTWGYTPCWNKNSSCYKLITHLWVMNITCLQQKCVFQYVTRHINNRGWTAADVTFLDVWS